MKSALRTTVLAIAAGALLPACSQDTGALDSEVAALRGDLQRREREDAKLREQIVQLERRLSAMQSDRLRPGRAAPESAAADGAGAAADAAPVAAPGSPDAATGSAPVEASPLAQAVRTYLSSDEGRKAVTVAIKAAQDQADQERMARATDMMLARFAKEANLSDGQVKQVRDIVDRAQTQMREAFAAVRDASADLTPEQRDQLRQQAGTKTAEIRQRTDDDVKAVLSTSQFEVYQRTPVLGGPGFGGPGAGRGGPGGGAGGRGN